VEDEFGTVGVTRIRVLKVIYPTTVHAGGATHDTVDLISLLE
jgi:hypothetical protein